MAGRQINAGSPGDATAQVKMVGHFHYKISARHSTDKKYWCYFIVSSVLLPRGRLAVVDQDNKCAKLIDLESMKVTGKISFSLEPRDITAIGEDRLAVVFCNPIDYIDENNQFQYKNKEVQFLQLLRVKPKLARSTTLPLPGRRYKGVTCRGEKLYLACWDPPSIQICDLDGTLLKQINQRKNEGDWLFADPEYIAVSPDGAHIYVRDLNKVVCLTTEGQEVWTFSPSGFLCGGMDVDKQGRLFVCGSDPPIHILSSAGLPGTLLLDNKVWWTFLNPATVAVCDRRMCLGGVDDNIFVYGLEAVDSARQEDEEDSDDFGDSDEYDDDYADSVEDIEYTENSDEEEEEVEGEYGEDKGVVNDREDDDGGGKDVLDNTEESLRENTVESVDMQLQYVCEDLPPPVGQSMNLPGDISLRDRESYRLPDNNRYDSPSENQPLELPSQILFRDTNRDRESCRLPGSNKPDVLLEDIEEEPPVKLPKFE